MVMPHPPAATSMSSITKVPVATGRNRKAADVGADTDWIIVASKQDGDAVEHILSRASANGVKIARVLWVDEGPIKFYCCDEDLWEGLFAS